jgi:hypothetical protein
MGDALRWAMRCVGLWFGVAAFLKDSLGGDNVLHGQTGRCPLRGQALRLVVVRLVPAACLAHSWLGLNHREAVCSMWHVD